MRARTIAPTLIAAAFLSAGCGALEETITETETVTETVAPEGENDRAYMLAEDVCGSVPRQLVAPFFGADADDPEELAEAFARLARPELREAAREGCLAALVE